MADHLEDHHFYCGECLLSFTCPLLVPIHFQLEHEFRCACDQRFSDRVELLTHMEDVGCRFPFPIEASKPGVTQLARTDRKSKIVATRRSLADGAFDAVNACIRKTDDGFSCSVCGRVCARRYRLWQHVKKSHSEVVKKMESWHLKAVIQKYCAVVGEAMACTVCGKPYLKRHNFYEHVCAEHTLEISQITVDDLGEVEEQDAEKYSILTVLSNHFYARVKGKYRCLICRGLSSSLHAVSRHLRRHGKELKERLDKSNVENGKLNTERNGSGLKQKSPSSRRSEVVVRRPKQELEFLRGYITKKEAFYYCLLCSAKSTKKGYLYQHLAVRHDDILGETLSTFRQIKTNAFEHKDTSESAYTLIEQCSGDGTLSQGNVVGKVEFHTDVWTPKNGSYTTIGSVLFNKSRDHKSQAPQSVADAGFRRLTASQDYGLVKVENIAELSSAFAEGLPDAGPVLSPVRRRPILQSACSDGVLVSGELCSSDGQSGDAVGSGLDLPLRKKPKLSLPKSPKLSYSSEVTKAFCKKTRTYVCSICNHKLNSKSGWYKHFRRCRVGISARKKRRSFVRKNSKSEDRIRLSESALADSQHGINPSDGLKTSDVKKTGGNGQKLWRCVSCRCQFISYTRWQRHFAYCKRKKRLTVRKIHKPSKSEKEFLWKNCRQEGQKFACRICGLDYKRIYDAFYHIRRKHLMAGKDYTDIKLSSALNGSPAKVKSKLKSGERSKLGQNVGAVNSGLKSTLAESVLERRAYVRSQILEKNGRCFCQICDQSFLLRASARKHINRIHLRLQIAKQPPSTKSSPVSNNAKNVASTKVNRLAGKVLYKPRSKNFTNGTKATLKGAKLKTEVGSVSLVKSCGLCSKRFLSLHNLTAHVASEHMTIETTPFPCVKCPREFEKRQYCIRHFVHAHCLSVKGSYSGKKFHCKICDINFRNKTCRVQHLSEVHADVCEVCSLCSAIFLTRRDLQKHNRARHSTNVSEGRISKDVIENQGSSKDCQISRDITQNQGSSMDCQISKDITENQGSSKDCQISKDITQNQGSSEDCQISKDITQNQGSSEDCQISKDITENQGSSEDCQISRDITENQGSNEDCQISRDITENQGSSEDCQISKDITEHQGSSEDCQISRDITENQGSGKDCQISKDIIQNQGSSND